MLSINEWDPLKKVVVGRADHAQIPPLDPSHQAVNYANVQDLSSIPVGPYPQSVIDEATQDLELLVEVLQQNGVEVIRPDPNHKPGYYNYCPRDSFLVYKDTILVTPQPIRSRAMDYESLDKQFHNFAFENDYRYCRANIKFPDEFYNLGEPEKLALKETLPAFDAANILRANDYVFYLVSNTGNQQGAHWLQRFLDRKATVYPINDIYSYSHIDSTIALLREGLMLLNPARIKDINQLPKPLQSWDVIWAPEPVDIGYHPGYKMASEWISMNLLSINPNLVVLEERQTNLRDLLEKHGIECIMLPGRHQRTLSGGFHCVTLDLEREHS
jgi:N-dimethylarginine dimethylaminohydrolase